jgi:hypothetical protein
MGVDLNDLLRFDIDWLSFSVCRKQESHQRTQNGRDSAVSSDVPGRPAAPKGRYLVALSFEA